MTFHCLTQTAPPRLGLGPINIDGSEFGVRQWKVIKLWYNLQYTQNLDNNHGLSITYLTWVQDIRYK